MREDFLQYIWRNRLYRTDGMVTTDGVAVEVLSGGEINSNAGPDFLNAHVVIDGLHWVGNVEVHVDGDDWWRHGHEQDDLYNNVILHVVANESSRPVKTKNGMSVAEVVLAFDEGLEESFEKQMEKGCGNRENVIVCRKKLTELEGIIRNSWIDRLVVERMEQRVARVEELLAGGGHDRVQTLFCLVARALGRGVNAEQMEQLARRVPLSVLYDSRKTEYVEAVLFGMGGMLDGEPKDDYQRILKERFALVDLKYNLRKEFEPIKWQMGRTRPWNFATVRIAQLAALVVKSNGNFADMLNAVDLDDLVKRLEVEPGEYWQHRYTFGGKELQKTVRNKLTESVVRGIFVNALVPWYAATGFASRSNLMHIGEDERVERLIGMLESLPAEQNGVLDIWAQYGVKARNEAEAGALLLLYKDYCQRKRCYICRFAGRLKIHTCKISED